MTYLTMSIIYGSRIPTSIKIIQHTRIYFEFETHKAFVIRYTHIPVYSVAKLVHSNKIYDNNRIITIS